MDSLYPLDFSLVAFLLIISASIVLLLITLNRIKKQLARIANALEENSQKEVKENLPTVVPIMEIVVPCPKESTRNRDNVVSIKDFKDRKEKETE